MSQLISTYIHNIQSEFDTGQSTEHSFRPALKSLLEGLDSNIGALNESQRITGVGMPDFTIKDKKNNTINIGWIEAKDLYVDLIEDKNKDQLSRYLSAFDNFIYTNNLTFNFYRQGKLVDSVSLGTCDRKTIHRVTSDLFADNIVKLERLLKDFLSYSGQTITSPEKLARAMAQKAQLIKYAIENIFQEEGEQTGLYMQYRSFKDLLIHDLTAGQFADMYAQTIAYGLFAARLHDPTLPTFSREEAEKLIPKSTPFIRWLFKQVADDDVFDDRIAHIVDDLVGIFLHCNVDTILKNYGRSTKMQDPIIHFYETFLGEYDSKMRKARGVYYTPEPVVKFIVKGVDHLLKKEFGLPRGLADTSKIEHAFMEQGKKIKKQVHRVQLLDPATGTGTFLNEVIRYIHTTYFSGQAGMWSGYVAADLLPRIRGFEILMASYTMAHLKLGLTLEETGWKGDDRINVYLTNSLEEPHDNLGTLFSQQLAKESEQASKVKKEQPIMVVMGNPPYSGESSNNGEWIMKAMEAYKKEPGGIQKLQEQNSKRINDDYVKFIRFAESFIEKSGEGIVAYICPHGFLDNPTFRGMRWKILSTFDTIYTVDLHGNSKKKEIAPDGGKDENVFDIQQGVAITFFVKTGKKKKSQLATVFHADLYGKRDSKYARLEQQTLPDVPFSQLDNVIPNYFMVQKDFGLQKKYDTFVSVSELFPINGVGMTTAHDEFVIDKSKDVLKNRFMKFKSSQPHADFLHKEFDVKKKIGRNILDGWNNLQSGKSINDYIVPVSYRPFDSRYIFYEDKLVWRTVRKVMSHFIEGKNIGLVVPKINKEDHAVFISNNIIAHKLASAYDSNSIFPLYLYNEGLDGKVYREPNLDQNLIQEIQLKLGMSFGHFPDPSTEMAIAQGDSSQGRQTRKENAMFSPEDIFDYIYAVLHSPVYREKYKEFLKIDFPRIPFTDKQDIFWSLVEKGHELRLRHLMEHPESNTLITQYPVGGDNVVGKISSKSYLNNRISINDTQYIDGVPAVAWHFYIGGYQPAQKRLKDRQGKVLSYDDINHYQKIIVALVNTHRVMGEIGKIKFI